MLVSSELSLYVFLSSKKASSQSKITIRQTTGADAINISGLLNPKKLWNFKKWML